MKSIIDMMFNITNNYGISIILLSITINIIILPLYYLAEKLKNDNQKILDRLQPRIDDLKRNYNKRILHFYIQALYKTNNYHPINNIKASLGLLLQIPFFIAAFHFIGNYEAFNNISFGLINNLSNPDRLLFGLNILPFLMSAINLISIYLCGQSMSKSEKYQLLGMSFIFLVFLYFESSALLLYWSMNNLFSLIRSQWERYFNLDSFKSKVISLLLFPIRYIKNSKIIKFIFSSIFIQSSILFLGTIFIYKAIPMAASDTSMYNPEYWSIVSVLIGWFIISISLFLVIYYFLSIKLKYIFTILLALTSLSGLFYSFIYPFHMEKIIALDIPVFMMRELIIIKLVKLLPLLLTSILFIIFFKKLSKIILTIIIISNMALLTNSIILGLNPISVNLFNDKNVAINTSKEDANKFYSFSKESNVVVVLMDMFQGNMLYDILDKYPNLKEKLQGFTYYPNTISHGNGTWESMGAIIGGSEYKLQHMREKISKKTLNYNPIVKDDAFLKQMNMVKKYNHSYSVYKPAFISSCDIFNIYKDSFCVNNILDYGDVVTQKLSLYILNISQDDIKAGLYTEYE
jgi:YidC/Oxa1 family membrane protein insertase